MSLEPIWDTDTRFATDSQPTVADGTIYRGIGYGVEAYDTNTGQKEWEFFWDSTDEPGPVKSRLLWHDGYVFAGSHPHQDYMYDDTTPGVIHALDANTGMEGWQHERESGGVSGVAAKGETVYVSMGSAIVALDIMTGATQWEFTVPEEGRFGSPVVAGNVVCAAHQNEQVYGLDATSGDGVWSLTMGADVLDWWNRPVTDGETVYLGDSAKTLYAIDATTGRGTWSTKASDDPEVPAYDGENVYVGGNGRAGDDTITAVDAATGDIKWSTTIEETPVSPVSVGQRGVYVGVEKFLYELDREDGRVRAKLDVAADGTDGDVSQPAITETAAFVESTGTHLVAVDLFGKNARGNRPAIGEDPPPGFEHREISESYAGTADNRQVSAADSEANTPEGESACPSCGRALDGDEAFCPGCGEELSSAAATCPGCGAELDGDEAFCPKCGHNLSE